MRFALGTSLVLLPIAAAVGCSLDIPPPPAGTVDSGLPATTDAAPDDPGHTPTIWTVNLRTEMSGTYLSAMNAGGGSVNAAAPAPREWETFQLIDENGGQLVSGDAIRLRAFNQASYLQAVNGGGGVVDATSSETSEASGFEIVRITGAGAGDVAIGDTVALRTRLMRTYVSAQDGGGGAVTATATQAGTWEHFVLLGKAPGDTDPPPPATGARVVGYLPNWYGSYSDWSTRLDFSKLTQINLAFALGDDNGNLQLAPDDQVNALVTAAHAHGVKVFPSLCGGGGDGRIAPHYQPGQVDDFVDKIIGYVQAHHMDGVDVDVEAPGRMGAAYDNFIARLKARAAPLGLPITAAVAPWMQDGMSDATLRSFDFITVMSYDNAGTWTGAGEHSSYQQAVDAMDFYLARGVARDRIVLGVPFYGYCWGNCGNGQGSVYVLYKDILARFPDASQSDWIDREGARFSYNGVATMKAKTELARQYGGVMIWELAGDVSSASTQSLLGTIKSSL